MAGTVDARLAEKDIVLPNLSTPAANYVPFVVTGNLVFVSGQVTVWNGELKYQGRLGADYTVDEGYQAARICGLNLIAQLKAACDDDLDRVSGVVKLGGFVNSTADFIQQPQVINGASDLMVEVFGDAGRHARAAVATPTLPSGVAVEVDGVFEIKT